MNEKAQAFLDLVQSLDPDDAELFATAVGVLAKSLGKGSTQHTLLMTADSSTGMHSIMSVNADEQQTVDLMGAASKYYQYAYAPSKELMN